MNNSTVTLILTLTLVLSAYIHVITVGRLKTLEARIELLEQTK